MVTRGEEGWQVGEMGEGATGWGWAVTRLEVVTTLQCMQMSNCNAGHLKHTIF